MTSPARDCPLCGQSVDEPHEITICGACHGSLHRSGDVAMRSTAEFSVDQLLADADLHTAATAPAVAAPATVACTWCGRTAHQVRKLLSHGNAHICNECVALCAEIMAVELGD
jgi:hypothetical protein